MKTLTVNIEDDLSEKVITAVLDALKLEYDIDDDSKFKDETERIMANAYLPRCSKFVTSNEYVNSL